MLRVAARGRSPVSVSTVFAQRQEFYKNIQKQMNIVNIMGVEDGDNKTLGSESGEQKCFILVILP